MVGISHPQELDMIATPPDTPLRDADEGGSSVSRQLRIRYGLSQFRPDWQSNTSVPRRARRSRLGAPVV